MDVFEHLEIPKAAFFACLNLVDFVTDVLVLLRLSCFLDSNKGQSCTGSGSSTCQPHPWWTSIGFVILLASSYLSSNQWTLTEVRKWNRLHRRERTPKRGLRLLGLRLIAFFQLSPFVDLLDMIKNGVDREKKKASMKRDLMTKRIESGPQALFQSYIMFSLGSQRELLNVLSIAVSILSLSLGLVDYYMQPADEDAGEEKLEHKEDPDIDIITSSVQGEVVGAKQDDMANEDDMASEEEDAEDVRLEIAQGADVIGSSAEEERNHRNGTGDMGEKLQFASIRSDSFSNCSSPACPEGEVGAAENDNAGSQKQLLRASTMPEPQAPQVIVKLDRPDSPVRMLYIGKLAAFAYLSCDMTLRCVAFAVNFSPSARGPGVAVATVFTVIFALQHPLMWALIAARHEGCEWITHRLCGRFLKMKRAREERLPVSREEADVQSCCVSLFKILMQAIKNLVLVILMILMLLAWLLLVLSFVVPLVLILVASVFLTFTASTEVVADCARASAIRLAALRFLEYVCHGVIIATIARTACGEPAMLEIQVFFPLLGLNLISYVTYVMMQSKVQKLAECEKSLIGRCSEILSPCLESFGFMAGSCKACVAHCFCCSAKTVDTE